jgi:HJR/Mrr/RecB family endonuclease
MARRQQSKEAAIFKSVTGLAALVLFLWFFSPDFRAGIQILFAFVVIAFLVWLAYEIIKPESPSPTFKTFTLDPYQTEAPVGKKPPTVMVEELKISPHASKLNISEKLRKIDWFQFEKLIELIYKNRGFTVERFGGAKPDGGVDLIVSSQTERFAIQCKHWRKSTVGVKEIREFLGALMDSRVPKGIYITLVGYSGEAKSLADKHGIRILSETELIKMLEESAPMGSEDISKLFSDERKFCPKCEKEMVLRTNRRKGNKFWGCSNFPGCKCILNCGV